MSRSRRTVNLAPSFTQQPLSQTVTAGSNVSLIVAASGTPTLLGAYHQRCLGCHARMDAKGQAMPQTCTGCHEEKATDEKQLAAERRE